MVQDNFCKLFNLEKSVKSISNVCLQSLEKVTESLQELAVNVCGPSPSAQLLSVMMSKVPNLTTLSLCNMSHSTRNIDNRGLSAIGSLSHLTSLNLMLNAIVSDHVIEPIVEGCQQLCNLNLSSKFTWKNIRFFRETEKFIYTGKLICMRVYPKVTGIGQWRTWERIVCTMPARGWKATSPEFSVFSPLRSWREILVNILYMSWSITKIQDIEMSEKLLFC